MLRRRHKNVQPRFFTLRVDKGFIYPSCKNCKKGIFYIKSNDNLQKYTLIVKVFTLRVIFTLRVATMHITFVASTTRVSNVISDTV